MVWILLSCVVLSTIMKTRCYYVGEVENSGTCTYNFQVWTPDETLMHQIKNLESKIVNASLYSENRYIQLENEILAIANYNQNISGSVEKELMKCSLGDLQRELSIKNLNLELKTEVANLWKIVNQFRSSRHHGRPANQNQIQQEGDVTSKELRNIINDLKGEWIYIKRDGQETERKVVQLQSQLQNMQDDTQTLKASIDELSGTTARLADKQTDIELHLNNLEHNRNPAADMPSRHYQELEDKIHELKSELHALSMHLDTVELDRVVTTTAATSTQPVPEIALYVDDESSNGRVKENISTDCNDIYKQGFSTSGVYEIKPQGSSQMEKVYCEMVNGTGWTVVQRREDGHISFDRVWVEYKHGFGSLYGEFWLGNEILHKMTKKRKHILRVDMWDWDGRRTYAQYQHFQVDAEATKYKLKITSYSGTAGDSLSSHDGRSFSTGDNDNDLSSHNCAADNKAGWWFDSCYNSNLNGVYQTGKAFSGTQPGFYNTKPGTPANGIVWYTLKESDFYSLKRVEMKIRPQNL